MPELPEVEAYRTYLEETSLHQKIEEAQCVAPDMLWDTSKARLEKALQGNAFTATHRHGKFLFVKLQHVGYLLLHFGMTGDLHYGKPDPSHPRSFVLRLKFANGNTLLFSDPRRLGKMALVEDTEQFVQQRGYGPDALSLSKEDWMALFKHRKVAIKTFLMDQHIVAGVGNEFSDAILFQCKIHPSSSIQALSASQREEVYSSMRKMLREAVHVHADRSQLDHYFLLNQRKAGLLCPRCGRKTSSKTIGGRTSYFCPSCQVLY